MVSANGQPRVTLLKRFELGRLLGKGGFGDVYEATDLRDGGRVAVKILRDAQPDWLDRFKREFRALQGLSHPNLVRLDELFFEEQGPRWFFTMELLSGSDLATYARRPSSGMPQERSEPDSHLQSRTDEGGGGLPAALFDESRLRHCLKQLLDAMVVLHAAGRVHRDIKPSNVMVTGEGRVVLLDFGLVSEASGASRTSGIVGTPAYMAPEQAALIGEVGSAADLYAVGVLLYEILAGRLPLDGRELQWVLIGKQAVAPPPPSSIRKGVPEDLDSLCMRLLQFEPARRPSAVEALHALLAPRDAAGVAPASMFDSQVFVGREGELGLMRAAFDASTRGHLATVLVRGESGIGKSSLVRHFMRQLRTDYPHATLLEGRCYERESVPYKAIDAIVDDLSRRLSHMPEADLAALLPTRSAALAQLFPVMLRLAPVAHEHAAFSNNAEPHELRQRAFLALRELFTRIAMRGPMVLAIDDLQWADDDGLRALAEILRPPEPPPLLVIGILRVNAGADEGLSERLRQTGFAAGQFLALSGLSLDEGRALASRLVGRENGLADPARIATESRGHPLFVEELARHALEGGSGPGGLKLDDAIRSRVEHLKPTTRHIAEIIAVAGRPLPQEIVARAAGMQPAAFQADMAVLRSANLIRTSGARWTDTIEPYHDRVREAAMLQLGSERRRELHEALALAFEASSQTDAEALATHWSEAGDRARAARYAATSGRQALSAFAFDRAARWYEEALRLLPEGDERRRELRIGLGDALAGAGRGSLAAAHYEAVAAGAAPPEALQLRRRAADQLLRSGHIDEGISLLRSVLAEMGIAMTGQPRSTLAALLYHRARLAIRGLRYAVREEAEVSLEVLRRIDVFWSVASGLSMVDMVRSAEFHTRGLLLALDAGEPHRLSRALAMEASVSSSEGGSRGERAAPLLEIAGALAQKTGRPETPAWVALSRAAVAIQNGRFEDCLAGATEAEIMFRDRCQGAAWELADARAFCLWSLAYLGRLDELGRRIPELLRDAIDRADLFSQTNVSFGPTHVYWLARDDVATMRRACIDVLGRWTQAGFHFQHLSALFTLTSADLYDGDYEAASARVEAAWPSVRESLLLRVRFFRVDLWYLRGRTAIAAALNRTKGRSRHLKLARDAARCIEREDMPWSRGMALVLRAALARVSEDAQVAIRLLRLAEEAFLAASMRAHAASCAFQRALLAGGGSELAGESVLRAEGVRNPLRFTNVLAPTRPSR